MARLTIRWSPEARSDLRAIDRESALSILHCIDRYLTTRTGDMKKLKPPLIGFRLRCGDYRIFFSRFGDQGIEIERVRNRQDAYR